MLSRLVYWKHETGVPSPECQLAQHLAVLPESFCLMFGWGNVSLRKSSLKTKKRQFPTHTNVFLVRANGVFSVAQEHQLWVCLYIDQACWLCSGNSMIFRLVTLERHCVIQQLLRFMPFICFSKIRDPSLPTFISPHLLLNKWFTWFLNYLHSRPFKPFYFPRKHF